MSQKSPIKLSSPAPYLLRALRQWLIDNGETPHLIVNTNLPNVQVPRSYIAPDGLIVLNVADRSCINFSIDNDYISFTARFNGVSQEVFVPIVAVIAIHGRDTGTGMSMVQYHEDINNQTTPMRKDGTLVEQPMPGAAGEVEGTGSSPTPEQMDKVVRIGQDSVTTSEPKAGSARERAAARWGTPAN